jgi:hypothetical protein
MLLCCAHCLLLFLLLQGACGPSHCNCRAEVEEVFNMLLCVTCGELYAHAYASGSSSDSSRVLHYVKVT